MHVPRMGAMKPPLGIAHGGTWKHIATAKR